MSEEQAGEQPAHEQPAAEDAETGQWYVSVDGQNRIGPLSKKQVEQMVKEGKAGAETPCWREGSEGGAPLSRIEELSGALAAPAPKADDVLAQKAKRGWSALRSAFRRGADGAARQLKKAELQMKISSIRKDCDKVLLQMGRELYEMGEEFLSCQSYRTHTEKLRSLEEQIRAIQRQIEELEQKAPGRAAGPPEQEQ